VKWRNAAASGIPKSTHWIYGDNSERYGWIDKEAFHKMFTDEFRLLTLLSIPDGK
jgi:hypothetical protein